MLSVRYVIAIAMLHVEIALIDLEDTRRDTTVFDSSRAGAYESTIAVLFY